jgi:hypothetical protein
VRRHLQRNELRVLIARDGLDRGHYCFLPARIIETAKNFLFDRLKCEGLRREFAASLIEK